MRPRGERVIFEIDPSHEMEGEAVVRSSCRKCQDCGNQAKKGCEYKRCRTCCNNKGFECETHVQSTWVPVDHRRRPTELHPHFPKRHKHNNNNPNPYPDKTELKFPVSIGMTATFRCVQVRSKDDWVNEYAYHTSVRIGGHVFCGFLYDQGPSEAETSSAPLLLHHNNNMINAAIQTHHSATMAPPPLLSSSSAHDSIFHPSYPFPLPGWLKENSDHENTIYMDLQY